MKQMPEDVLASLTPDSSLLVVLRTLYRLRLEYCVLLREDCAGSLVFTKDQLVALIERVSADTLVRDLPKLAEQGLFRPLEVNADDKNDQDSLVLEKRGAWAEPLWEALLPRDPDYPDWWEAPLPFALCDRGRVHINQTALLMFGADLERVPVMDLPDRDEFIIELEGRSRPCFLTFRRLEPDIFILEDSTNDLIEAEEISWWASVGKAWSQALDAEQRRWRRAELVDESFKGTAYPCDWDGHFLGYFCVDPAGTAKPKRRGLERKTPGTKTPQKEQTGEEKSLPAAPRKRARRAAPEPLKREDEVLKALGPQTMALLAAGQVFEEPEAVPAEKPENREKGTRRRPASKAKNV